MLHAVEIYNHQMFNGGAKNAKEASLFFQGVEKPDQGPPGRDGAADAPRHNKSRHDGDGAGDRFLRNALDDDEWPMVVGIMTARRVGQTDKVLKVDRGEEFWGTANAVGTFRVVH